MTRNDSSVSPQFMTLRQVARYLKRSDSGIHRLVSWGILHIAETTPTGRIFFDRETVHSMAETLANMMTTTEVSAKLGVCRLTVSRWEKKKIIPSLNPTLGKKKYFAQETVDAFAASLDNGMTKMDVACYFGVPLRTVSTWVRYKRLHIINGKSNHLARFSREDVKALGAIINEGITTKQVAKFLKVSIPTVLELGKSQKLRAWKTSGHFRFDENEVAAYAKTRCTEEKK